MKFSNGKCSPRSKISTLLIAREPPAVTASRSSETEVRSSKSSRLRSFQYITSIPSDQVFSECRVPATFWGPATLAAAEVCEYTASPYILHGTIASMSPHMIGVQPPSLELSPFPELLGPPPHFRGATYARRQKCLVV